VFGLPGNPASALVTFELFARPALRALAGLRGTGRHIARARLAAAQDKPAALDVFLRARVRRTRTGLAAMPLRTQLSGHLTSVAGYDALALLPAGRARFARGAEIEVMLLGVPEE